MAEVAYIGDHGFISATTTDDPKVAAAVSYLNAEMAALKNAGFSELQTNWNVVKDYMESGAFTNTNSKYFNPGNITWSKHSKTAKKGRAFGSGWWAVYDSLDDYATDLLRVLSLSPGKPINATTLEQWLHGLKLNNYFDKDKTEQQYVDALRGAKDRVNILSSLVDDSHQDITTPGGGSDKFMTWWHGLDTLEKGGIIAGATIIGVSILKG